MLSYSRQSAPTRFTAFISVSLTRYHSYLELSVVHSFLRQSLEALIFEISFASLEIILMCVCACVFLTAMMISASLFACYDGTSVVLEDDVKLPVAALPIRAR